MALVTIKNLISSHSYIRRGAVEKSSSRLTSAVKPLMELLPSEAVIDIKPEMDDDLIAEDPVETSGSHGRVRRTNSRPTAEIYRPGQSRLTSISSADPHPPTEGSTYSRQQDSRVSRTAMAGSSRVCLNDMHAEKNLFIQFKEVLM